MSTLRTDTAADIDTWNRTRLVGYLESWGVIPADNSKHPDDSALRELTKRHVHLRISATESVKKEMATEVFIPHTCPEQQGWDKANVSGYGVAVDEVHEGDNGSLWVGNGEYGSRVNFCPFCGMKAKAPMQVRP